MHCTVGIKGIYLRVQSRLEIDLAHLLQQKIEQVLHILWRLVAWRKFQPSANALCQPFQHTLSSCKRQFSILVCYLNLLLLLLVLLETGEAAFSSD
jgi:hypothetical protein